GPRGAWSWRSTRARTPARAAARMARSGWPKLARSVFDPSTYSSMAYLTSGWRARWAGDGQGEQGEQALDVSAGPALLAPAQPALAVAGVQAPGVEQDVVELLLALGDGVDLAQLEAPLAGAQLGRDLAEEVPLGLLADLDLDDAHGPGVARRRGHDPGRLGR